MPASQAHNGRPLASDAEGYIELQLSSLYGCNPQAAAGFTHNRVFCADALFIRTENTVGARERATAFSARGEI